MRVLKPQPAVAMLRQGGPNAGAAVNCNERGAAELAEALGRLPLALHVAGRRLEKLALADGPADAVASLRAELARKLLSLTAGERRLGITEAEPTLEAILALSYDALPTDAQGAFRRLAVFAAQPADFDAAALAAVWGVGEDAARELRSALLKAGLLERWATSAEDDDATAPARASVPNRPLRFSLHQVIAAFSAQLLAAAPVAAAAAALVHAQHYAGRAEDAATRAEDEDPQQRLDAIEFVTVMDADYLQMLRAVEWAKGRDEAAAATVLRDLVLACRNYMPVYRGRHAEYASWLDACLIACRRLPDRLGEAHVLRAQGDVLAFQDQREAALARYEAALGLYRAVGARLGEAHVLQTQGKLALGGGAVEEAMSLLDAARTLYLAVGDRVGVLNCGIVLGRYFAGEGEFAKAIEYMQPAADFTLAINHPLGPQLQAEIDGWRAQLDDAPGASQAQRGGS